MSELYPETDVNIDMFGRKMTCCTQNIYDCPKFKKDGYNCDGLNEYGMVVPWGFKEPIEFQEFLKNKLFGSCKCLTQNIDIDCPCGIIIIDNDDINLRNTIYLSCFKNLIMKRAELGSKIDINALKYGREVYYNF